MNHELIVTISGEFELLYAEKVFCIQKPVIKLLLLHLERLTVCTLFLRWVAFMSSYFNTVQCAIVLAFAMVTALLNTALDANIRIILMHNNPSFP